MKALEERIKKDGRILPGDVLKVDSFLNHQIDVALISECGKEWYRLFKDEGVTKILTIEASGAFRGRYHVLGGKLSPVHRVGPDSLRFRELGARVMEEGISEVLIAVSTDMEGDATAGYLAEFLAGSGAKTTRLAFGLPADSGVSYSDPLTLRRAINLRTAL